jgi:hypothetical protein
LRKTDFYSTKSRTAIENGDFVCEIVHVSSKKTRSYCWKKTTNCCFLSCWN